MEAIIKKFAQVLKKEKDIALVSHIQPDGDAIGSILGLGLALIKSGKRVQILNPHGVPPTFTFLPGADLVRDSFLYIPESVVLMDCTDLERIGDLETEVTKVSKLFNIDHHISNKFFGDYNLVDTNAGATGEIAYNVIKALGVKIDSDIASCLYTAIVTDTGSFKFENTTSETHLIAADLLNYGMDLGSIRRHLWESTPIETIRLLTETLATLEMDDSGEIAWVTMPYQVFQQYGAAAEHLEGVVNYAKSVQGVEIGIVFKEMEPNQIRVGLRSKATADVNQVAQALGGGGHKRAAGCTINGSLKEAKELVIREAKGHLEAIGDYGG